MYRKMTVLAAILFLLTFILVAPRSFAAGAYYVSPTGSDANSGTSAAAPFQTLQKARSAMEASKNTKTVYVMAGSYDMSGGALTLTSADNGETWQYYPANGYNTAVLDGHDTGTGTSTGATAAIAIEGASNVTINGLKMQNFRQYGIYNHGGSPDPRDPYAQNVGAASGNTFENNDISTITVTASNAVEGNYWMSGCVANDQDTPNTKVLNNYCHNVNSMGIRVGNNSDLTSGGNFSGTVVSGNYISDTCLVISDCGAVYAWNPNATKSTNVTISDNFIKDYGPSGNLGHALYYDYEASNITATGNIISGSDNTTAILVSDGNNNVFKNNLFDVQDGTIDLLWYINITGHQKGTGNAFTNNVVLAKASAFTQPAGVAGSNPYQTNANSGPLANISVQHNYYCNYNKLGSGPWPDYGNQFSDASPALCSSKDPGISGWAYSISRTSPVFNSPVNFAALPTSWGPPGFAVPQTGTAPSSPLK